MVEMLAALANPIRLRIIASWPGPRLREPPGPGDRVSRCSPCLQRLGGRRAGRRPPRRLAEDGKTMKIYQVTDRYPPFRLAQ